MKNIYKKDDIVYHVFGGNGCPNIHLVKVISHTINGSRATITFQCLPNKKPSDLFPEFHYFTPNPLSLQLPRIMTVYYDLKHGAIQKDLKGALRKAKDIAVKKIKYLQHLLDTKL